jgi:molybdopterin/thiamine biosynthesis adenylyltransferase
MITLAFPAPHLRQLRDVLQHDELESAAILLCVPMRLAADDAWRLIVREVHVAPPDAYLERTPIAVRLDPAFGLPLEKAARLNGWSLVYVHTHPHSAEAVFSKIDDTSESAIGPYAAARIPGVPHVSLLFSRDQVNARVLGGVLGVRVIEVGANLIAAHDPREAIPLEERFDRQVRAFGVEGQSRVAGLTIGVVGLGGTGSLVAQQLAHLGVSRFVLVDDDLIEATNLNRVVGAVPADVAATSKVDVAERQIRALRPDAVVVKYRVDVTSFGIARRVAEADLIFNCTDTHASRHVLNQVAYQHLTPVIDMGVSITVDDRMRARLAGHAKMMAPGLGCLWCARHLDPGRVREELMTEEQRRADPYFQGAANVEQPAVISLNGAVASVAVTMFLAAVAGVPSDPRYVIYDGNRARMNAVEDVRDEHCNYCGVNSTAGWGDTYALPAKAHGEG